MFGFVGKSNVNWVHKSKDMERIKKRKQKQNARKRKKGPPRGFGDLGRRAIYFQGAGEHCLLF